MLVIISRSDDDTVNLLTGQLKKDYIRINLDSDNSWSFSYVDGFWFISSDGRTHQISENTRVWWWKAYLDENDGDSYRNAEVEYLAYEIYNQIARIGTRLGNSPLSHKIMGKIAFLEVAKKFFRVPETISLFNHDVPNVSEPYVAKSLASVPFSSGQVLYTTVVNLGVLNGKQNPWFLQRLILADLDVTVFVVGSDRVTFSRCRSKETLDWRKEQLDDIGKEAWIPHTFTASEAESLGELIQQLDISWGRFDLLRDASGVLWMLELNWNGQFGFLDPYGKYGLFERVARYLEGD